MRKLEIDIEKAKSLYESGLTCQEVADKLNVCKRTILRRFEEIGYKTREPNLKHGMLRRNLSGKQKAKNKRNLYPKQVKARELLNYHLKKGNLIKPNYCSNCGVQKEVKEIESHHKDYNKPLEVIWLCNYCHREVHKLDPHSYG